MPGGMAGGVKTKRECDVAGYHHILPREGREPTIESGGGYFDSVIQGIGRRGSGYTVLNALHEGNVRSSPDVITLIKDIGAEVNRIAVEKLEFGAAAEAMTQRFDNRVINPSFSEPDAPENRLDVFLDPGRSVIVLSPRSNSANIKARMGLGTA